MVGHFRRVFNATYDGERFARYGAALRARTGDIGFPLAETPVFLEPAFADACARAGTEIVEQLADPHRLAAMRAAVENTLAGPTPGAMPQFAVVDFAIATSESGELVPKLVELQGFPSLLGFEIMQFDAWAEELDSVFKGVRWSAFFGGMDRDDVANLARETIVADCDPKEVVLLDIEPARQKTACDFRATEKLFGVEACDPRELYMSGGAVHRRAANGAVRRVRRIYNRIVGDDLLDPKVALPFDLREDVVEWAAHPSWFWTWSKASLPLLDHPSVPKTYLLSELTELPDLKRYVLKPLFSYAGSGVNIRPERADVEAIPAQERSAWCLQEKIEYAEALEAADGGNVKVEIRLMFVRPDHESKLVPVINLCRLSRGEMHGVDHNKGKTWVGSSIGIWPAADLRPY